MPHSRARYSQSHPASPSKSSSPATDLDKAFALSEYGKSSEEDRSTSESHSLVSPESPPLPSEPESKEKRSAVDAALKTSPKLITFNDVSPESLASLLQLSSICPLFQFTSTALPSSSHQIVFTHLSTSKLRLVLLQNAQPILSLLIKCTEQISQMDALVKKSIKASSCSTFSVLSQYEILSPYHSFIGSEINRTCTDGFKENFEILKSTSLSVLFSQPNYQELAELLRKKDYFSNCNYEFLLTKCCTKDQVTEFFAWIDSKSFVGTDQTKLKSAFVPLMYSDLVASFCPPYRPIKDNTSSIILSVVALIQLATIFFIWQKIFGSLQKVAKKSKQN